MAVTGTKIVFVGSNGDAKQHISDQTKVIELDGDLLLPGFIEGHIPSLRLRRSWLFLMQVCSRFRPKTASRSTLTRRWKGNCVYDKITAGAITAGNFGNNVESLNLTAGATFAFGNSTDVTAGSVTSNSDGPDHQLDSGFRIVLDYSPGGR